VATQKTMRLVSFVSLAFIGFAFAEEEKAGGTKAAAEADANVHPLTDMPEASPDVVCNGVFPKIKGGKVPLGQSVDAIVGIVNEGQEAINVTYVMGSINSPFDSHYYVQNFTKRNFNKVIHEDEEYTFRYRFTPMDSLDPVEYHMSLTAFYENEEELFSHTFFNSTVTFYEPGSAFDMSEAFKYLGFGGGILAVIYMLTKSASGSTGASSSSGAGDFLEGYNEQAPSSRATVVKRRKKTSGKKRN